MGLRSFFKTKEAEVIDKSNTFGATDFIPVDFLNGFMAGSGGSISKRQALNYFLSIPELYQVIAKKAKMFSNGNFQVVSKKTELPVNLSNPIAKLLNRPNWHQGAKEFLMQTKVFRELYENEYLHFNYPLGFKPSTAKQLNSINPLFLDLPNELTTNIKTPLFLTTEKPLFDYKYTNNGQTIPISSTDILQINNPVVEKGVVATGRLDSLSQALYNIKGAYESRGTLIYSRGALGILSNALKDGIGQSAPFQKGAKEALQKEYEKYGLTKSKWQLLITNMSLNYQRIAMNPKELMLFEEIEDDFNKIVGAFELRREIFPTVKGTTFENQKEAIKAAYVDSVIPEAEEWVNALNTYLGLDDKSYHITVDFTHLSIFAEDLKNKGIALKNLISALSLAFQDGAITLQEYKDQLKEIL